MSMVLTMDNIIPVSLKHLGLSLDYQYRYGNPQRINSDWVMNNIFRTVNDRKSAKNVTYHLLKANHLYYRYNKTDKSKHFYYNYFGKRQKLTLNQTGKFLHLVINHLS